MTSSEANPLGRLSAVGLVRVWGDMIKFSHSIFALPFAVMAAVLAGRSIEPTGRPAALQFVLILVCMVAARSVAMTFNRIVDVQIDARNPRTATRPLPAGKLSQTAAYVFLALGVITFGLSCLGFYAFFANPWPVFLGGPVLLYLCGYSFTKRFTKWSHVCLGSAIALAPVASWLAIHPESLGWTAFLLMGAVTFWIAGFDVIYACQDIECDRRESLFSLPSRIGAAKALLVARAFHAVTVLLLLAIAKSAGLGWIYLAGVGAAAILLAVENSLVKPNDFSKVNLAFFTVNGMVSIVLSILTVLDVLFLSPSSV